ncbi:hypothetical protein [Bizionia sp.]|uniref:hypothetical protein n=1 Tax=Bizionia sp. TaxID=1954480 RepID=UPI003A93B4D9
MKKLITLLTCCFIATNIVAQNNDYDISLAAYVPDQIEGIPASAKSMLNNKLGQVITNNGISNNIGNSRFIITSNITIISKDIIGSAPSQVALTLDMTLYIGDGIAGNMYASESFSLKGVGKNETKAYMQAIKQLKSSNPKLKQFVTNGKAKILDYYNTNCNQIIAETEALQRIEDYNESLYLLVSVPTASTCYDNVKGKIEGLFKKAIDKDCLTKYAQAQAIWNANQDIEAANESGALLASVNPRSACFNDVKKLFTKIEARVQDLQDRTWKLQLHEVDIRKSAIQAAKEVGVAYGKNQPNTVYNIRGWY